MKSKNFILTILILCFFTISCFAVLAEDLNNSLNETVINESSGLVNESLNQTPVANVSADLNVSTNVSNGSSSVANESLNQTPVLTCSASKCDKGCVLCNDGSCHEQAFVCKEELNIEKITPATLSKGEQQLNVLIKNTGNVALSNIEADISGYGVVSTEKMSISSLNLGDKDYTFTKVNITQSGKLDIIVKLYVNNTMRLQQVFQINVNEDNKPVTVVSGTALNITEATAKLDVLKSSYNSLEADYYSKEKNSYILYGIKEDLADAKENLRLAQVAIIEQNQKDFDKNVVVANSSLLTVSQKLSSAQQEQKSLWQTFYDNLAVIGTLLGVLISLITIVTMTNLHVKVLNAIHDLKDKQLLHKGKKDSKKEEDSKHSHKEHKEEKVKEESEEKSDKKE